MNYDAVIVGGGPSGLSAGALMANSGMKVLVLEMDGHMKFRLTPLR